MSPIEVASLTFCAHASGDAAKASKAKASRARRRIKALRKSGRRGSGPGLARRQQLAHEREFAPDLRGRRRTARGVALRPRIGFARQLDVDVAEIFLRGRVARVVAHRR